MKPEALTSKANRIILPLIIFWERSELTVGVVAS
jgi:hypothetical protein